MDQARANEIIEEVRKAYQDIAAEFSDTRTELWNELKPFAGEVQDGMTIADIGCGNGRLLQLFQGKKVHYIGIDNSGKLLRKAQQYASGFPGIHARFQEGDIRHIPLQNASCDAVFCIATLHHIPTIELQLQALRECQRILKPEGFFVMTNWYLSAQPRYVIQQARQRLSHPRLYIKTDFRDFFISWKLRDGSVRYRYYRAFTPRHLRSLLTHSGFSSIRTSIAYGERDWSGMRTKRNIVSFAVKKYDSTEHPG